MILAKAVFVLGVASVEASFKGSYLNDFKIRIVDKKTQRKSELKKMSKTSHTARRLLYQYSKDEENAKKYAPRLGDEDIEIIPIVGEIKINVQRPLYTGVQSIVFDVEPVDSDKIATHTASQ